MTITLKAERHTGIFIRPLALLIAVVASIFAASTMVNLILSVFSPLSLDLRQSLMDAGLMVVVLFPVMYFFMYEPLTSSIRNLHRSEEALQESEAKFRSIIETADDSIYVVNRNCEYMLINAKYRSRLGIASAGEYEGKAYRDFHSHGETAALNGKVRRIFETGESLQQEYRSKDGKYFLRTLSPIKNAYGEVAAVSVVSKDITRVVKGGEAELRYRAIFEQSPYGIVIVDTEGNMIDFNEVAHSELGYSRDEFGKLRIADIDHLRTPEEIRTKMKEVLNRGWAECDVKHRTKDGDIRDVHVIIQALDLLGTKVFQAIWQDVTESRRCEEEMKKCREQIKQETPQ